ncbi:Ribonuclease BN, tRNA processing enzyme [Lentzea xinjiangensis]|uniref:Ribonuclease BN, tRNA processing enzyme n=1 Tax=Lentzea xinjiangensis TaxID=402600 RepID=A0A1H9UTT4_9PSEU|nr:MBL fold metallo-hydrolase [Lentzea xinjiangensis]SES12477.1 Ribonuclease BN, tRNA processing enzyme [Lentzea xinjiangensis]
MLLTVLGCSGSIPGPGAAASGYLLEADGFTLALEFGNGVLSRFQEERPLFSMDALVLSHLHPDHCIDVSSLYVARKYHPSPPAAVLPVYAPAEAHSRFAAAYAPNEAERSALDLGDVFSFHRLGSPVRIGPFTVDSAIVAHPCEAYGFRISCGGVSLAYTGDSGPCEALEELSAGVDVLLSEASWTHSPDRQRDLHMSGREAGELAARAGAGRLLVTHVPPWTSREDVLKEAKAAFGGPCDLVVEGGRYEVGERA